MTKTLYEKTISGELLEGVLPEFDITGISEARTTRSKETAVVINRRGNRSIGIQQNETKGYLVTNTSGATLQATNLFELRGIILQLQGKTSVCRKRISFTEQWKTETTRTEKSILALLVAATVLAGILLSQVMLIWLSLIALLGLLTTATLLRTCKNRAKNILWGKQPAEISNPYLSTYTKHLLTTIYSNSTKSTSPASFVKSQFLYDILLAEAKMANLLDHPEKSNLTNAGIKYLRDLSHETQNISEENWRGSKYQKQLYDLFVT